MRSGRRLAALALTVTLATGAVIAYKRAFVRPGEESLTLLPASTVGVLAADLGPSPQQLPVFKRLDDALRRNNLAERFDSALFSIATSKAKDADLFKPYLTRSAVVGILKEGKQMGGVMILPVTDPAKVAELLKAKGTPAFWKGTQYSVLRHAREVGMILVGDRLVVSEWPWVLHAVRQTETGKQARFVDDPDFQAARNQVMGDANMMLLVSPKAFADDTGKSEIPEWLTLGVAVRDGGVEMAFTGKLDDRATRELLKLGSDKPLPADLLQTLPAGSYGQLAFAGLAEVVKVGQHEMERAGMKPPLVAGESGPEAITEEDVMPALKGNSTLALYPNPDRLDGLDLLLVVDAAHGGTPGTLLQKLLNQAEEEEKEEGRPFLARQEIAGVKVTMLDPDLTAEMRKDLTKEGGPVRMERLLKDKTLAVAEVDGVVIGATSLGLLERAIAAHRDRNVREETPAAIAANATLAAGAQVLLTLDVARVMQGANNTVDLTKMSAGDAKNWREAQKAAGHLTEPFLTALRVEKDGTLHSRMIIPVDWDATIDAMGSALKK